MSLNISSRNTTIVALCEPKPKGYVCDWKCGEKAPSFLQMKWGYGGNGNESNGNGGFVKEEVLERESWVRWWEREEKRKKGIGIWEAISNFIFVSFLW